MIASHRSNADDGYPGHGRSNASALNRRRASSSHPPTAGGYTYVGPQTSCTTARLFSPPPGGAWLRTTQTLHSSWTDPAGSLGHRPGYVDELLPPRLHPRLARAP